MSRFEDENRIWELLSALADERLTAEEFAELDQWLSSDKDARTLYIDYIDAHLELIQTEDCNQQREPLVQLREELIRTTEGIESDPVRRSDTTQQNHLPLVRFLVGVAAATLAVLGVRSQWKTEPQPEVVKIVRQVDSRPQYFATLRRSSHCVWNGDGPRFAGQRLRDCKMNLQSGLVELGFDSGVRLVVEGPAQLEIFSSSHAMLRRGKVVLHGDEASGEFSLETPHSTLFDVGTEFGAAVGEDGTTEVHVFSGTVRVEPQEENQDGNQRHELRHGEARQVSLSGVVEMEIQESKFARYVPASNVPVKDDLLVYEDFQYETPNLHLAESGIGWAGIWKNGNAQLVPAITKIEQVPTQDNPQETENRLLVTHDTACIRQLATPIRMDTDAVYYVRFRIQRLQNWSVSNSQFASFAFHTDDYFSGNPKIHFGMNSQRHLTISHLPFESLTIPPRLKWRQDYLFIGKIVAGETTPDQVMLRIYEPDETLPDNEPTTWNCSTNVADSNDTFDRIRIHVGENGRYWFDDIRVGKSWESITDDSLLLERP